MKFLHGISPRRCFTALLRALAPDLVFDCGSRDGRDALVMRRALPSATIVAVEANPTLVEKMKQDVRLRDAQITVYSGAIGEREGVASFSIFHEQKGTGSLLKRGDATSERYDVSVKRLDSFSELQNSTTSALWIDVEGNTYEALIGAGSLLSKVILIHAEIETEPLWEGQHCADDVEEYLFSRGFSLVLKKVQAPKVQGNAVFIRTTLRNHPRVRFVIIRENVLFTVLRLWSWVRGI